MTLEATQLPGGELADHVQPRPVLASEKVFDGMVWDVLRDTVDLGEAGTVQREYVRHTGAVIALALDDRDRVLFIQQYRHPVQSVEWELPAGLLDQPGETPWVAVARELHEEADLTARRWNVLMDFYNSPGGMSEAGRIFLARDLASVPYAERFERSHEERGMPTHWVDLDEAHDAVLRGALHNPSAVIGVLAAHAARAREWVTLRPHDAPWPDHPAYR